MNDAEQRVAALRTKLLAIVQEEMRQAASAANTTDATCEIVSTVCFVAGEVMGASTDPRRAADGLQVGRSLLADGFRAGQAEHYRVAGHA